jgi:hypothetical protein
MKPAQPVTRIIEYPVGFESGAEFGRPRGEVVAVGNGQNQCIEIMQCYERRQVDVVFVLRFAGVAQRIVHEHLSTERLKLADDIGHAAVAEVGHVFLEREPKHADARALYRQGLSDEEFDGFLGNKSSHAVVDAAASENDVGIVAELFRL